MKHTTLLFILLFFLLLGGRTYLYASGNGGSGNEVLFINSINFNLPWAKNLYWQVHDELIKNPCPSPQSGQ